MKKAMVLFEQSGVFANLLKNEGYEVILCDLELGIDILTFDYKQYKDVDIIIAHPPCTEFAVSGARWWKGKAPELLKMAIRLVEKTIEIIEYHKPRVFFIENPVGRIEAKCPKIRSWGKWLFNPNEFAGWSSDEDAYTKKTVLYGRFNIPQKKVLPPVLGSKTWSMGWRTPEIQRLRSVTALGFAKAFVKANLVYEYKDLFTE